MKLPGSDVGDGWWIFDFKEGDLGVHPVDEPSDAGTHNISFYCADIQKTVAELKSRGVQFTQEVENHGYGLVTYFTAPGAITIQLYQPRYVKGISRTQPRRTASRKAKPRRAGAKRGTGKERRQGTGN
jgi:hypothetical protein